MKNYTRTGLILALLIGMYPFGYSFADTPPPGTVKSKTWSGDGNTAITVHGTALDVNVTNTSGLTTVNQGSAGSQSWLASITSSALPTNACVESGGHLASIDTKLTAPLSVTGPLTDAQLRATAVPISGSVTVSGTITATNSANGATGSAVPAQATQIAGTNGGTLRAVKVSSTGVVSVDGSASTQPISAASLPLPADAATETTQLDVLTALGSPFQAGGAISNSAFGISGTLPAYASTPTFNLGTLNGAATAANQATEISSLSAIDANTANIPSLGQALAANSVPVVLTAAQLSTLTPLSTVAATQSGAWSTGRTWSLLNSTDSVNAVQSGTWTVTLGSLGGAATAANQATEITALGTINTTLGTPFQAGGSIGNSSFGISGTLPAFASTPTFNLGTLNGAATATLQGTGNTSLSSIDGKTPALGQALAAGSVPVVLTAAQLTTLTPPTSVTVSGTVTANAGTGTFTVDGSGHTQPVSIATAPVLVAGSAIIGKVGIDQTTPGTTNGVQVNAALPAGSNVIGHVIVDTAPTTAVTQSGTWTVNSKAATPTALTVTQAAITVGTSAVRLTVSGSAPASTRVLMVAQLLSTSTANCYFGSSGVTSSSTGRGIQMFAGQSFTFTNDAGDYYAICDSSSQTFFVTEQQ